MSDQGLTDEERLAKLKAFRETHSQQAKSNERVNNTLNSSAPGATGQILTDKVNPPGPGEATLRGMGSGFLGGFQPQVAGALSAVNPFTKETYSQGRDIAAARNDQAFNDHPYAYGSGYAGGATGLGLITGGLGEVAPALNALPILDNASKFSRIKNFVEPARRVMNTQVIPKIPGATAGSVLQGIGGAAGAAQNEKPAYQPNGTQPSVNMNATPLSEAEDTSTNKFASLLDYIKQSNESLNPEVQQLAQQAQLAIGDGSDDAAKRKSAMVLQSSKQGRAVGNSDSPLNGSA
jgi:hypothetical protein